MSKIREWVKEQYELEEMKDIVRHGCVSGAAHGAIYYSETDELYERFKEKIWDMLHEAAQEHDMSIIELLSQFGGKSNVGSDAAFKNLLVWWAIESICFEMVEGEE